jgi:hypothetical protein
MFKLVSEFWRPSAGKSSPNTFWSLLWNPLPILDLDPVLLTVVALATEGRRSSLNGKPMLSSRLLVPGRKPGEGCETSSFESLKKLLHTPLAMLLLVLFPPLGAEDQGVAWVELEAVGGFRDMEGTRPPEVSSTASCFRCSPNGLIAAPSLWEGFHGRCEGSLGGGAGGTVPGEMSLSLSALELRVLSVLTVTGVPLSEPARP